MPIEQDYILRLIAMGGEMVRRAMEKDRAGRSADALVLLDEAVEHLVSSSPRLIARLTPDGLVAFLGAGGAVEPLRATALADALDAKAAVMGGLGRLSEAGLHQAQAAALREAAGPVGPTGPHDASDQGA